MKKNLNSVPIKVGDRIEAVKLLIGKSVLKVISRGPPLLNPMVIFSKTALLFWLLLKVAHPSKPRYQN